VRRHAGHRIDLAAELRHEESVHHGGRKESSHLWKPRLHEVAAGLMNPGEDQVGYLALARAHGFRFHYGALAGLDSSARTIRLAAVENTARGEVVLNPRELDYDDLVLALGSQVNDFGIEGVIEHCHMLDSSAQASAFNRSFLNSTLRPPSYRTNWPFAILLSHALDRARAKPDRWIAPGQYRTRLR
jgi:hypothetical protein